MGATGRFIESNRRPLAALATLMSVAMIAFLLAQPSALAYVVAIVGVVGGAVALYEIHNTKQLAQAGFIRDLNAGFAGDTLITELWGRLLLDEPIERQDRVLISSYFTFFETIYLLLQRRVLRIQLIDDLFRNRFFTAIGNPQIQDIALIANADAFQNVYALVASWSSYLRKIGAAQHPGYYRFLLAKSEAQGLRIAPLSIDHLDALDDLQERVSESMDDKQWLRNSDSDMLAACLNEHLCLGTFGPDGRLTAAAILFDGGLGEESVLRYVTADVARLSASANVKVVLVAPEARRSGIARTLLELLECHALEQGKHELACTIHPRNRPSRSLFKAVGFSRQSSADTKYGRREVFVRSLPAGSQSAPLWD